MKTIITTLFIGLFLFSACKKSDSTTTTPTPPVETVPTVTTVTVSNITSTSAVSGGVIVNHGTKDVIKMGVAWSRFSNPGENGFPQDAGVFYNSGPYSCTLQPLQPNTLYYYQAYATNANGFGWGEIKTFTTLP